MSYANGPKIVTDGLVLCLDAANRKSYPGSGSTWYDTSGRGNNATLQNGSFYSSDGGGSIILDGTNDRISVADSNGDLDFGTNDFSINIWLYQQPDNTYFHLYALDDQYNFSLKAVRGDSATNPYGLYVYQGYSVSFTSTSYLIPNTWQMITLTRDYQDYNIYIDGELSDTATDSSGPKNITGSTAYIGWGWGTEYTPQKRGPIQIYNRGLTANEVQQNYNALKGRFGL